MLTQTGIVKSLATKAVKYQCKPLMEGANAKHKNVKVLTEGLEM
jgi:hypothetical protein